MPYILICSVLACKPCLVALSSLSDLHSRISNAEDWRLFSGVPVIGVIKTDEGSRVVHLSNYFKSDRRIVKKDEAYEESGLSYFAAVTDKVSKPAIFLFDVDSDGFLLQAVETIKSRPITDGMCAPPSTLRLP